MASTRTRTARTPHRFAMWSAYFLLVFLVLFPKGGIKAGSTPLTWGYLFIALTAPFLLLVRMLQMPLRTRITAVAALGLLLPMQILLAYAAVNGIENTGYAVSMVVGLVLFPWLFLAVYPPFFPMIDAERLSACLRFCMLAAALWGIFLFFLHPLTGHYIEIRYLTVNAADYGLLETTKFNARGFYLKLIATYNNGNLYGVATLILLPLYKVLEPRRWRRGVMYVATLLTLSRTVWVGLVILESAPLLQVLFRQARTFPVVYLGAAVRRTLSVFVMIGLVLFVLFFATNSGLAFLLDPTLGGRASELGISSSALTLLPPGPLRGFDESLYGSALHYYGVAGLFCFSLIMVSPVFMLLLDQTALRSKVRMAAFGGLMLYAVMSLSDGAFVLIPVTAFYWFVYAVFLYGWPGTQRQAKAAEKSVPLAAAHAPMVPEAS